jgi:hypothetical protein
MLQKLIDFNKNLKTFLEKPVIKYGFLILAVVHIIFITYTSTTLLELYENIWFKVLIALLIAYSACFDPVYSLAIATLMIISIQELHRRRAHRQISKMTDISKATQSNIYANMPDDTVKVSDTIKYNTALNYDEINKHALQKTPENGDTILGEYDYYLDPAYQNLTQTVREQNILRNGSFYVSNDELDKAQTNKSSETNQQIAVQAFPQELNAQGIPNGFDKAMYSLDSKYL